MDLNVSQQMNGRCGVYSLKTPQEGLMPYSQRIFARLPYLAGQ